MKSKYIGLWMILAVSLAVLLLFSFSDLEIGIGDWKMKKAPFKEHLTAKKKHEAQKNLPGTDSEEGSEAEKVVKTDSLPHSILLIGDSMTLNIAYEMSRYAKQNGHDFHAVNWDSSNTRIWSATDTLSRFIRKFDATYVFVSLGSNELYLKNCDSRRPDVKKILEMIGDLPYVWIGPPNWKEDYGINDMLESECRKGSFFRSAGMEFERKKDKIHPTRKASALWVDSIMRWLPKSAHPILADLPSDSLKKVNPNVTFLKAKNK